MNTTSVRLNGSAGISFVPTVLVRALKKKLYLLQKSDEFNKIITFRAQGNHPTQTGWEHKQGTPLALVTVEQSDVAIITGRTARRKLSELFPFS